MSISKRYLGWIGAALVGAALSVAASQALPPPGIAASEPAPVAAEPAPAATPPTGPSDAPKRALMLIEAEITDMPGFGAYVQAIMPVFGKYGGRYVVMRGARNDLEGDWGATRIVISEWPSMAAAQAFWDSADYQAAKELREDTGSFRVTLLEMTDPAPAPAIDPPPAPAADPVPAR